MSGGGGKGGRMPPFGTTTLASPRLREHLEFCMAEGKALIILGVEEQIDPMLVPVTGMPLARRDLRKQQSVEAWFADKPRFSMRGSCSGVMCVCVCMFVCVCVCGRTAGG